MNSRERFKRMYEHKEADRVPIIDSPWAGTLSRWRREGMPEGMDWRDYFGVDKAEAIGVDISPRYPVKILEETDRYVIRTSEWGVTAKHFKEEDSTPEFLDFRVSTPDAWADAKRRMAYSPDRIPWEYLKENFPRWQAEGRWTQAVFWFGFDVTHSWMAGTETLLIAMLENRAQRAQIHRFAIYSLTDFFRLASAASAPPPSRPLGLLPTARSRATEASDFLLTRLLADFHS